jgi:hypothetical protein
MARCISSKNLKFIELVASGVSYYEALKTIGTTSKGDNIRKSASKLATKYDKEIKEATDKLNKPIIQKHSISRESLLIDLEKIKEINMKTYVDLSGIERCVDGRTAAKCIEQITDLFGLKVKQETEEKQPINIFNVISEKAKETIEALNSNIDDL